MKEEKADSMPVGKRTRNQRALREKELCEKNKRARLTARSKHRKKNYLSADDGDEEDVKVVDEAEYLRRTSMLGGGESSPNVSVGFEGNSDDSVKVVGEKWNPLGVGLDHDDDDDDDDEVNDGYEGCGDLRVDSQSWSMDVGTEGSGGVSDGCYSSPMQSSASSDDDDEEDDKSSDEDFKVGKAEMCSAFSSEYFSSDASGKYGKWKGKRKTNNMYHDSADNHVDRDDNCLRKKIEGLLNENNQRTVGDELYMQSLENDPKPKNAGNIKRGWPGKKRNVEIEYELENDPLPENSDGYENGSFIHSSSLPRYHGRADNPVGRDETCLRKINEGFLDEEYLKWLNCQPCSINNHQGESESEPENEPNPGIFACGKRGWLSKGRKAEIEPELERGYMSENSGSYESGSFVHSSLPFYTCSENGANRERGWLPKNDLFGEFGGSENGSNKKSGRLSKGKKAVVESEPENFGNYKACSFINSSSLPHFPRYQNGGHRKRGRPPKNLYNGSYRVDFENFGGSENSGKRKRGRPPKNLYNGSYRVDSENFGGLENSGKRKRGRPPKNLYNGSYRVVSENFGGSENSGKRKRKRGRPPKNSKVKIQSTLKRKKLMK